MQELVALLSIAVGIVFTVDRVRTRGWSTAWQGPLLVLALCVPPWLEFQVRSVTVTARMAVSLVVFALFLLRPLATGRKMQIYPSDCAIVFFLIVVSVSDIITQSITPFGFLNSVLNWVLPYLLGRLFLSDADDLKAVLPAIVPAAVLMAMLTFAEGLAHQNWFNTLLQKSFGDPETRWGMKRASGPQSHPIYWGLTLAIMLPFLLEAARQAKAGNGPPWWRVAPWLILPGIVATGSRSAQIATLLILLFNVYYQFPRFRSAMTVVGLVGAFGFVLYRDDVLDLMSRSIGESDPTTNLVKIRGELHEYSGTRHRDLLFLAYQDAIEQVQPLGYGSLMKGAPKDLEADDRFDSIDNQYLRCYLQYGPVGTAAFTLLVVCCLGNFVPLLTRGQTPIGGFAAGILGSLIAMLIALRGVWLSWDFGWYFLLYLGMSGCLETLRRRDADSATDGDDVDYR
jgi:hypothetical protein